MVTEGEDLALVVRNVTELSTVGEGKEALVDDMVLPNDMSEVEVVVFVNEEVVPIEIDTEIEVGSADDLDVRPLERSIE